MSAASKILVLLVAMLFASSHARAQVITSDGQCSLPGPNASNYCTIGYYVRNNPASSIVCLWNGNNLRGCEGLANWGGAYEFVYASGTVLEFRRHSVFPTSDPDWPNASVVKGKGALLTTRYPTAVSLAARSGACSTTVAVGQNIQTALSAGHATVCLAPGTHTTSANLVPVANQTLRAASGTAIIRRTANATSSRVILVTQPNVQLQNLTVEGTLAARAEYGVLVYGGSNTLIQGVTVNYSLLGIGINNSSSNVEVRSSTISYPGDQVACSGCAQPSVYIDSSSNVRIVGSTITSNGVGPEGDGELACYNSTGVVVHSTSISGSGAAGMYLVNCDSARILNNDVVNAREWGLDIVDNGGPSGGGSDYILVQDNVISGSRNGGVVLQNSGYASFTGNSYLNNRSGPGASGSCNGVNRRGGTTGFFQTNDSASPAGVSCND